MDFTFLSSLMLLFIIILVILLIPSIEYKAKLRKKAKADYLNARGTIHRNILQRCLGNLGRDISDLENRLNRLKVQRANMSIEKEKELEAKLTAQIVDNELDKIPGIGEVLKDRVMNECFNGTLESLNKAGSVQGIGEEKGAAISRWVKRTKAKIPQLLLGDYQGKSEILKKYSELDNNIETEIKANDLRLQEAQQLMAEGETSLTSLESVGISTFLKVYDGDKEAADKVTQYLEGVFPEWRSIPQWFKTMVEKYDKA